MKQMFKNYDNPQTESYLDCECKHIDHNLVQNIKGTVLGIKIKHLNPVNLFFHLNNFDPMKDSEAILSSTVLFEVVTTTGKSILRKELAATDCFIQPANDIVVHITQEEAELLKQESYKLRVFLCWSDGYYKIFSETDGLLIVR